MADLRLEPAVVRRVLEHPGFFRVEKLHAGHLGECPHRDSQDELSCWRFQIGVAVFEGSVAWFESDDLLCAFAAAARALNAEAHEYQGATGYGHQCSTCGVGYSAHGPVRAAS